MKYRIPTLFLATIVLASLLLLRGPAAGQEPPALSLETHIPLPNVKGRIDHSSIDVKGQRLFVAAVDNHTLELDDRKSGRRVHTIADLAQPQRPSHDPATTRLRVACGPD